VGGWLVVVVVVVVVVVKQSDRRATWCLQNANIAASGPL